MSKSSIGIKIANGSYYKILDEGSRAKKRLVLTTVKDGQTSVQIDLYRGQDSQISDAQYIGSLVIDSIKSVPAGEPDIELVIGVDKEGNLNATASDRASGERQTLSVSMASLSEESTYDIPEFAIEDRFEPANGVSSAETSGLTSPPAEPLPEYERPRRPVGQIVLGVLLGLVVVAIIVVLLVRFTGPRSAAPPVARSAQPAATQPAPAATTPAPAAATAQAAPAATEGAAVPQGRYGGVNYYIRWGDTLWDLSISFYRTPWLYGKIAKANSIKNPDLIFAHTTIYIPDR